MSQYRVVVSNIGTVFDKSGNDETFRQAESVYAEYKQLARNDYGRAAHEDVTLIENDEILAYYDPDCDSIGGTDRELYPMEREN